MGFGDIGGFFKLCLASSRLFLHRNSSPAAFCEEKRRWGWKRLTLSGDAGSMTKARKLYGQELSLESRV